ncbi:zf-TFIIB domain-containing protein [Colwellia sp. D2M02]|uniref:zf-TFIIB domain-containing protein n=1 Tax=Colwellia sp. D2M02 TaxID=2841562 RepID=UPI001C09CE84|nr:zf-TFIIB domain-containing protein [Colwellia sp. D2M02]MBU2893716.1 zf-TFIIB domain-containing protein [Colwellia sp. D2M02]
MKCPVDGDVLSAEKAEAHTGYGCASCKGSWLPKSYIDSIQYTKEFDPHKFFSTLKSSGHDATNSKCPVNCGVLSSISDFNGISYCPSCLGVWFESKALKNMLNNYQTKREDAAFADIPNASVGIFDLLGALFK